MSVGGNRLSGKVSIVTGAGSGFGAAIAQRFAQEGCRILIGDINEAGLQKTAGAIGGDNIISLAMDGKSELSHTMCSLPFRD